MKTIMHCYMKVILYQNRETNFVPTWLILPWKNGETSVIDHVV